MTDTPTVSVVIPAFNRAKTISAAIASVLRQTYRDFEIIVVDDGSTDDTLQAAQTVADPRVRVVSNPRNMGAAGARNTGISLASGEWIAFQDSDDEWLPTKLEKQMERLTAPGTRYVAGYCGLLTLGGLHDHGHARVPVRYTPDTSIVVTDGDILLSLLRASFVSTQTLIARRAVAEKIHGFDTKLVSVEDWDFAIRLSQHGPFAFVDEPLVLQRFSPNSISRNTLGIWGDHRHIVEKHMPLLRQHPKLLAQHFYMLAGGCRLSGDIKAAQNYLSQGLRLHPANAKMWAMTALLAAMRLKS